MYVIAGSLIAGEEMPIEAFSRLYLAAAYGGGFAGSAAAGRWSIAASFSPQRYADDDAVSPPLHAAPRSLSRHASYRARHFTRLKKITSIISSRQRA